MSLIYSKTERSGTGEGVPPTIIHLAEHNGSYANAKVLTLCGRFLFNIHHSLNSKNPPCALAQSGFYLAFLLTQNGDE